MLLIIPYTLFYKEHGSRNEYSVPYENWLFRVLSSLAVPYSTALNQISVRKNDEKHVISFKKLFSSLWPENLSTRFLIFKKIWVLVPYKRVPYKKSVYKHLSTDRLFQVGYIPPVYHNVAISSQVQPYLYHVAIITALFVMYRSDLQLRLQSYLLRIIQSIEYAEKSLYSIVRYCRLSAQTVWHDWNLSMS